MKRLNYDRWFYRQPNGFPRLKRVSAENEARFPREYRLIVQRENLRISGLILHLRTEKALSLTEAWEEVQRMMGGLKYR